MSFGIFYPRIQQANFFFVVKIQIFNEETSFRDFLDFFWLKAGSFNNLAWQTLVVHIFFEWTLCAPTNSFFEFQILKVFCSALGFFCLL